MMIRTLFMLKEPYVAGHITNNTEQQQTATV